MQHHKRMVGGCCTWNEVGAESALEAADWRVLNDETRSHIFDSLDGLVEHKSTEKTTVEAMKAQESGVWGSILQENDKEMQEN